MTKFIEIFYWKNGWRVVKSFTSILNIDVTNSNFHKEVYTLDIGTKAKSCFAENLIPDEKQMGFKKECVCFFFVTVSQYLI